MKHAPNAAALLCTAAFFCASGAMSSAIAGSTVTVSGWPASIAMGGIGGPDGPSNVVTNISSLSCGTAAGTGNDDFQGAPVDVIFTYAGNNGAGDAGVIVPPWKALAMTGDLTTLSGCNSHATRDALVEYTAEFSGGESTGLNDFTDSGSPSGPNSLSAPTPDYVMARHLISLGADAMALNYPQVPACTNARQGVTCNGYAVGGPVAYNGSSYYGTLILNPDLLGTVEQNSPPQTSQANWVADVSSTLNSAPGGVNKAVSIALCVLTNTYSYTNTFNPNDSPSQPPTTQAYDTTYTGTPVQIMEQMLADGYPPYSLNFDPTDHYWPGSTDNITSTYSQQQGGPTTYALSQVGTWLYTCAGNSSYPGTYQPPNFANTLDGWIQANNWIVRTLSPKGNVTFGWHEDMYAATSNGDFWLQKQLTESQVASTYSGPVTSWLQTNAPDAISSGAGTLGANYVPDYFVFDRYGEDDSNAGAYTAGATLYNAQSWDNYLTGVGQISRNFNNIPVMMWQIPGSHISNTTESNPETTANGYVFSSAPVYFFGDSNLTSNLSNIVKGTPSTSDPSTAVGNFDIAGSGYCGPSFYNCASDTSPYYYSQWLLYYQGLANNFNWGIDNGKRAKAAANNVFAILWGAGNAASNVVPNQDSTPDNDHGWLAGKIVTYYQNPTTLAAPLAATHDFNGDRVSDILWRDTSGNLATWLISNGQFLAGTTLGGVPAAWSVVGARDFNHDGMSDILWLDTSGDLAIWQMNGEIVDAYNALGNVGTQWKVAGTGDFNGDGTGDILWRNQSTGDVAIWLMSNGQYSSGTDLGTVPSVWQIVGTGDFNGDGTTDILWRNNSTGDLSIWLISNGRLSSGIDLGTVPLTWSVVGTGDFSGDGTSDILWRDGSGDLAIWMISNGQVSSNAVLGQVATTWAVAETGDFNGDGKSDILWLDGSGDLGVWLMNGLSVSSAISLGNVGTSWKVQGTNAD